MTPAIPSPLAILLIAVWFAQLCASVQLRVVVSEVIPQDDGWTPIEIHYG